MNIKKYLQQQAEKDAESLLTESDRQFCMQLAQSVQQPPPKRKRSNLAAISSVAAACLVALVLGITLPLTLNRHEVRYKEENVTQTTCTAEDVNYNSKYFKIEESEGVTLRYQLNYDSVTGDKLYYTVGVATAISKFTLNIVINEKYDYKFEVAGNILNEQLSHYSVEYNMQKVNGVSTQLLYKGSINVESETVYIDYTQEIDIGDEAFFGDIQSVLKLKN